MKYRALGSTGLNLSTVSFGTWAIGGSWGTVDEREAMQALNRALDLGVNFFDTADVYGDGRSERLLGKLRRSRSESFYIATKAGMRLDPHIAAGYTKKNLSTFIDHSLKNLGVDTIDLFQLHSPPTDVYYQPEVFGVLEDLVQSGKVRSCGVSVNRVEEGLKAMEYPVIQSVQLVYNIFRQRPADIFLAEAKRRNIGVIARLPLSSGMLTGKINRDTHFESDDHRSYNRTGDAFDRGETFSGVDYDVALEAVGKLIPLVTPNAPIAQWALRWVLMNEAVTCVIPGGRRPAQIEENVVSAELDPLTPEAMAAISEIYSVHIKPFVHARW